MAVKRRQFLVGASAGAIAASLAEALPTAGAAMPADLREAAEAGVVERSIAELGTALADGSLTSVALTQAYLARIERFDRGEQGFHSVLATNPAALADAARLDAERAAGRVRGPLHGMPLVIKDNIESRDPMATTAGSLALAAVRHSVDAPLVARLREAGAIVLGKGNLSEWANYRSTRSTSGWSGVGGQTHNAYDRRRNPSGSSSGSAAATALSFCAAAIGSETDGSILAPASVNGLVGLKPTVGLISGEGIVPISPRQDTAGPMGRSVRDVATLLAVLSERPLAGIGHAELSAAGVRGLRIGVMKAAPAHPSIAAASTHWPAIFEKAGARVLDVPAPKSLGEFGDLESDAMSFEFKAAINAYLARLGDFGQPRDLAGLIAFNDAHAAEEMPFFGQELFLQAQGRADLRAPAYLRILQNLKRLTDEDGLARIFKIHNVDLLLAPCNGPAELIDHTLGDRSDASGGWPSICSAAAVAGYPSLTVPALQVDGLPVGAALVAPRAQEVVLLRAGLVLETGLSARRPPALS